MEQNNLAVLNLHVTPMPPAKFGLNPTYHLGAGGLKILKMATVVAILDIGTNNFSNSESLCCSDASQQVSAQSDIVWEEMLFEDFPDSRHGSHLGYWNRMILAILNLHVAPMPPAKFELNLT